MTQSHPTNFHIFERKHILAPGESIYDWREITEAEKVQLEKSDSEWVEPEQWLIDCWEAAGSVSYANQMLCSYNRQTGYFETNGLNDITTQQAIDICATSPRVLLGQTMFGLYNAVAKGIRTHLPFTNIDFNAFSLNNSFKLARNIEVIRLPFYANELTVNNIDGAFDFCNKLHTIITPINISGIIKNISCFNSCRSLVNVEIKNLRANLDIRHSLNISLASVQYLVSNAANSAPISITVHTDVYAKLTDESNEEWHKVLTDAMEKQITFATS